MFNVVATNPYNADQIFVRAFNTKAKTLQDLES